ncbi:hypothetical protein VPH35_084920 [Triticum aestivum]
MLRRHLRRRGGWRSGANIAGGWRSCLPRPQEGHRPLPCFQAESLWALLPLLGGGPLRRRLSWACHLPGLRPLWASRARLSGPPPYRQWSSPRLPVAAGCSSPPTPVPSSFTAVAAALVGSSCCRPDWALVQGAPCSNSDTPWSGQSGPDGSALAADLGLLQPLFAAQTEALHAELQALVTARVEDVVQPLRDMAIALQGWAAQVSSLLERLEAISGKVVGNSGGSSSLAPLGSPPP